MPNALLARYFQGQGLFDDLDIPAMKETPPDELFSAWLALPDVRRNDMDAEFQDIFELSCEKGFRAILDEAAWHLAADEDARTAFVEKLAALSNHFERAMVTFLDHNQFWHGATRFYHADTLSYWRKRKNLPHQRAAADGASLAELADLIRKYFHHTEGRGNNCVVEPFRRGERDYFFAYPEDYSQQSVEWVDGEFGRRPHNPAFEVIYVYSQIEGSLDLNFRGPHKPIEPLQGIFATAILKLPELPPDPKDERVYDLNPLRQKGFDFIYDAGSGIQGVAVKKLRLSSKVKKGDRITVEADAAGNPMAVYELLDQIGKSLPLHLYNVTQVELAASVMTDPDKPAKSVTIRITHPNSCSLKYDALGLKLRDMLKASGIEPREPEGRGGDRRSMTPEAALIELLARVGVLKGAAVLVSDEELTQWPAAAVAAMKSQGLLAKARPAASAICPGCERECSMPVHTVPDSSCGGAALFIVCDKRGDINRVPVSAARLTQWRCDAEAVRRFIAMCLGLRLSDQHRGDAGLLNVGIASGDKRRQMLSLSDRGRIDIGRRQHRAAAARTCRVSRWRIFG